MRQSDGHGIADLAFDRPVATQKTVSRRECLQKGGFAKADALVLGRVDKASTGRGGALGRQRGSGAVSPDPSVGPPSPLALDPLVTRTAIALVDLLQRAGWVKRALFLADRVSLVNQAIAAFKAHLPESSPVNLVTEKDKAGRVYVSTYPTMMGLIDETNGNEACFSVGHFDLVIIYEAHRSVYEKYGAIFRYFDSLLVGLTATPSDHIDRNTYTLFDLEPGVPTDAYELETAVADGFLVPPRVQQVDLKFPREGIDYDSLSEEEQE